MTAQRAKDLPVGSVVGNEHTAWIKATMGGANGHPDGTWHGTNDELGTYDWEPQEALNAGAQVLRVGDGSAR